jgi:hypothetical protein
MTEPTDSELLDFDRSRLEDWSEGTARRLLEEEPVIYRNHLKIAKPGSTAQPLICVTGRWW